MKKKLALLMAAIMTVAMVPMTAFAASYTTDFNVVDYASVAVDGTFTSTIELSKDENISTSIPSVTRDFGTYTDVSVIEVEVTLDNAEFSSEMTSTFANDGTSYMETSGCSGIWKINVINDHYAIVSLDAGIFNGATSNPCVLVITATAEDEGDITATISSNNNAFASETLTIGTAYDGDVSITSDGVVTFVEDSSDNIKEMEMITISGLYAGAINTSNNTITLKLKDNYEFATKKNTSGVTVLCDDKNNVVPITSVVYFLNDSVSAATIDSSESSVSSDEIVIAFTGSVDDSQITKIYISGIYIEPTSKCEAGDEATLIISSKDFSTQRFTVAKMVEEAVTYSVEDDDLPTIWAGKDYASDDEYDANTLEVYIEENTGDILNTSRKATFTFPDGIEIVALDFDSSDFESDFEWKIDENVVTIWNYSSGTTESEDATDFGIKFLLNAAPTYEGNVTVTLGGEFDDVEFTVATVQAPYTVEAKTSEVLIDYRYVPVNEIVITEAEEGILAEDAKIYLEVEKMDFEDAGTYEVTEGDIEVEVTIDDNSDNTAQLVIEVTDESTEASTITISGLELYLDRTLPVGGYALQNIGDWDASDFKDSANYAANILWENSSEDKDDYDADAVTGGRSESGKQYTAIFKYDEVVCNDSYVEVVTAARDQDDSTTSRKIVITIGATTMTVGTETITLDAPAYINSEDYTMLPVRAISEAFGATVTWDDASKTVTVLSGQRIISMTIGSKTMYINGTPVAMNTAAEITNDRTFIPVRDLANSLGISAIDWNEASATVTLN